MNDEIVYESAQQKIERLKREAIERKKYEKIEKKAMNKMAEQKIYEQKMDEKFAKLQAMIKKGSDLEG